MRLDQRGQVLPLFAITLVALFAMAALLFDAAQALVVRRQLQDAGDAAALAAANVIQTGTPRGCSATAGPPPGAPRNVVRDAARNSVAANLPTYPQANVVVTCPNGWSNGAARVQLTQTSSTFFRSILGAGPLVANTQSTAVNSHGRGNGYSVITLNPYNAGWSNSLRGCPSMLFAGSPNVTFEGNVQIDSACPASGGGALTQSGSASTVTMAAGRYMDVVGQPVINGLLVLPSIRTGRPYLPDPLAGLPPVNVGSLTVRSGAHLQVGPNQQTILQPGVYTGGIEVRNNSTLLMRPGIYVMNGGGFTSVATGHIYTISWAASPGAGYTGATWATDCPVDSCGVLIYNAGGAAMSNFEVTAGATFLARGYKYDADTGAARRLDYEGLLLWQDRLPLPTATTVQPQIRLNGGGTVNLTGTVYGPSGPVRLGGTSGGGGGWEIDYALQFIVWDLLFQGTADWRFQYSDNAFVQPPDYGLVE
ncbi:MAG TPA: pilus assembly protein TadG-related protein [Candidatus Limnocylindrales bacterium]|jgi:hypothetical protein|nr:pilus assembly protein TadG-related protein [Candidatus Limnocylindrales bacterium]